LDQVACCLIVAFVAHLIFVVGYRVFALARLVTMVSALALALILDHRYLSSRTTLTGLTPRSHPGRSQHGEGRRFTSLAGRHGAKVCQ
jgi:hypothetical protein